MNNKIICICMLILAACNNPAPDAVVNADSISPRDSLKRALQEDLPPSSDIKQFNWFYSVFAQAAISGNDSVFNVVIHPKHGLWIIDAPGAMPRFTKVYKIKEYKNAAGKGLLPFDKDAMLCAPKEEELPIVNCDSKNFYNKTGCFSQLLNAFAQDKIWLNASLDADKDKEIAELASTIMRTVVNTANYKYYFSLIDGTWYLTFIDVREPCSA